MGHIINPILFRLGIIKPWITASYSRKNNIRINYFIENIYIYKYIKGFFNNRIYLKILSKYKKQKKKFLKTFFFFKIPFIFSHLTLYRIKSLFSLNLYFLDLILQNKIKLINKRYISLKKKKLRDILKYKNKKRIIKKKRYYKYKILIKYNNLMMRSKIQFRLNNNNLQLLKYKKDLFRFSSLNKYTFKRKKILKPFSIYISNYLRNYEKIRKNFKKILKKSLKSKKIGKYIKYTIIKKNFFFKKKIFLNSFLSNFKINRLFRVQAFFKRLMTKKYKRKNFFFKTRNYFNIRNFYNVRFDYKNYRISRLRLFYYNKIKKKIILNSKFLGFRSFKLGNSLNYIKIKKKNLIHF